MEVKVVDRSGKLPTNCDRRVEVFWLNYREPAP
jgi:hypothetical protein